MKCNLANSKTRNSFYFNAAEWIHSLKDLSLVLGTRIYDCIAAPQSAGVPSVITTIDSCTEGLAETLGLPRVKIHRLDPLHKPVVTSQIIDVSGLDLDAYRRRRSSLLWIYSRAITDSGLTLSPSLASFQAL